MFLVPAFPCEQVRRYADCLRGCGCIVCRKVTKMTEKPCITVGVENLRTQRAEHVVRRRCVDVDVDVDSDDYVEGNSSQVTNLSNRSTLSKGGRPASQCALDKRCKVSTKTSRNQQSGCGSKEVDNAGL
jgi:hypothetical protein